MTDHQALFAAILCTQKIGNRLSDNADIFKGEIFGKDATPPGRSKLDLVHICLSLDKDDFKHNHKSLPQIKAEKTDKFKHWALWLKTMRTNPA